MSSEPTQTTPSSAPPQPLFIIVMGVASTGKSTLAKALNEKLGLPYVEGDDLHFKSSIEKMSNGIPLTDADREPWLELIRTTAEHMIAEQQAKAVSEQGDAKQEGGDGKKEGRVGVMVTCSALKRYYRDILRGTYNLHKVPEHLVSQPAHRLPTYFVYIKAEEHLLRERMAQRKGHFMKPQMLDSQLATLESPEGEEGVIVVPLDRTTEEQVQIALDQLEKLVGDLNIRPVEDRKRGEAEQVDIAKEIEERGE